MQCMARMILLWFGVKVSKFDFLKLVCMACMARRILVRYEFRELLDANNCIWFRIFVVRNSRSGKACRASRYFEHFDPFTARFTVHVSKFSLLLGVASASGVPRISNVLFARILRFFPVTAAIQARTSFAHNSTQRLSGLQFFFRRRRSGSQAIHDSFARPVAIEEKTPAVSAAHGAGVSYKLRRFDANFLLVLT